MVVSRCGKARPAAIHRFHTSCFEFLEKLRVHRAQIGMEQPDECAAKEKVETAKRDERRGIVEHAAGGVLEKAALLQQTVLHDVAQAVALV